MATPYSNLPGTAQMVAPSADSSALATPGGWVQVPAVTTTKLGARIDGWADTVIGRASTAPDVARNFAVELLPHLKGIMTPKNGVIGVGGMSALAKGVINPLSPKAIGPSVVAGAKAIPELIPIMFGQSASGKRFQYQYVSANPGFNIIAKISTTGNDLFVSWDMYVKRVWNEAVIGLVLLGTFAWTILQFLLMLANPQPSAASLTLDPIAAVYGGTVSIILAIILNLIGAFLVLMFFVGSLGTLIRRDFTAYFFKEIDLFEFHDVYAMQLGVHKGLLRSIDASGIDSSLLRKKEEFRGGQRDRVF